MIAATSADIVLADLDLLRPVLFKAVEAGVQHARDYFEWTGRTYEPYLFSTLVRTEARSRLRGLGHEAEYEIDETQNLGLHLHYTVPGHSLFDEGRVYHIRIRKAFRGAAPVPGQSHRGRRFYNQGGYIQGELPGLTPDVTNLLILWDVTAAWMMKPELLVACPMGTAPFGSDVPCSWQLPITAPYAMPAVAVLQPDDDDEDLDLGYITVETDEDAGAAQ